MTTCKNCGFTGEGAYCSQCGQAHAVKRITVHSVIHEITHLFTHLDKGFLYTLRSLAIRPGHMQREYIEGHRSRHQKPFSMLFVCATITALAIFWTTQPEGEATHADEARTHFYRHYYVIMQMAMTPFYALVTWLLFRWKSFNYAESLVLSAYTISFSFLLVIGPNALNLLHAGIKTEYIELGLLIIYNILTNINFFNKQPAWLAVIKSIANMIICWGASYLVSDAIMRWLH